MIELNQNRLVCERLFVLVIFGDFDYISRFYGFAFFVLGMEIWMARVPASCQRNNRLYNCLTVNRFCFTFCSSSPAVINVLNGTSGQVNQFIVFLLGSWRGFLRQFCIISHKVSLIYMVGILGGLFCCRFDYICLGLIWGWCRGAWGDALIVFLWQNY